MKIAFIGGGNMGEAIIAALLDKAVCTAAGITVSDVSPERREALARRYGVATTDDNRAAVSDAEVVVIAVKPQNVSEVLPGLRGALRPPQLALSIMAGINLATLRDGLGYPAVVRVMPNTPAQVGVGMSAWTATPEVTVPQRVWAGAILGAMGKEVYLDDEAGIDMATAVSGSGPAYVFLLAEAMIEAAEAVGLSPEVARELVLQTVFGSAAFMDRSDKSPAELRRLVTSPHGTTAAALDELNAGGFTELMKRAVSAAHRRAQELGGS